MLLRDRVKHLKNSFYKLTFDADFKEEEHPRDDDGKFTSGGGSSKATHKEATKSTPKTKSISSKNMVGMKIDKDGNRTTATGKALPEHIASLKIPPAWKDVIYSEDPKASLLVKGKDSKGRVQYIYSSAHTDQKAQAKFARIEELQSKFSSIAKQNEDNVQKNKEDAIVLKLIMETGIRPGSDGDTSAKVKAYGATTLEGKHVEIDKGKVILHFIGKKGVENKIPVSDPKLVKILIDRKKQAGDNGKLFKTDSNHLLRYSSSLDGGGFKTKDFRTLLGTKAAMEAMKKTNPPKNEKEYKKAVMSVAKKVSEKLGNTPAVALKSYINPIIWQEWRMAIS